MTATTDHGEPRGPYPHATRILLAVTVLNVLNYADRYLMTGFATRIVPELGLTNAQFGLLTGPVFVALYLISGAIAGTWADRRHRPGLMALGVALWSAITALTGATRNFWQMAAARTFIGVGESSLQPAALAMLSDAYPPARRALAAGVFYLGIPLGVGGAFLYAAAVGPTLGWRGGFYLLGGIGVAGALLVRLLPDPPRGYSDTGTDADLESRLVDPLAAGGDGASEGLLATFLHGARTFGRLVSESPALAWTLAASCTVTFVQGATVLDVLWWVHERGYEEAVAQRHLGLLFLSGGVVGAFVGGIGGTVARIMRLDGPLIFLFWTFVVTIPMNIAYRIVPGHGVWFYTLGFGGCVLFMLFYGPISAAYQDIVPAAYRGVAGGGALVLGTGSAALGSFVVGWLADMSQSFDDPYTRAIQACQTVGLLALPALWMAAKAQREAATTATVGDVARGDDGRAGHGDAESAAMDANTADTAPPAGIRDTFHLSTTIPGDSESMTAPRDPAAPPAFVAPTIGWASPTEGAAPNTFRRLDGGGEILDDGSAFVAWYTGVRDVPLHSMGTDDLARAVRNGLYPEETVPLALHALEDDPLLGAEYPGELLASVALAGAAYWRAHPDALEQVLDLGRRAVRKGGDASLELTEETLLAE